MLTVVTGASANHFASLCNLLASLRHHEPNRPVEVHDLGLTPEQRDIIEALTGKPPRRFAFEAYPPHLDFHRPEGAKSNFWKPVLMLEAFARALAHGDVGAVWMDAGNLVHGPLKRLDAHVAATGFYAFPDPYAVEDYAHPATLAALKASPDIMGRQVCGGAVAAFTPKGGMLLGQWCGAALNPAIARPPGWNRLDHRSDQILLAVLMYQAGYYVVRDPFDISVLNDDCLDAQKRYLTHAPQFDWWLDKQPEKVPRWRL